MKQFFVTLPGNLAGCFKGWMLFWHLVAVVLTAILVFSELIFPNPIALAVISPAISVGG